jgi:hypothetical protein
MKRFITIIITPLLLACTNAEFTALEDLPHGNYWYELSETASSTNRGSDRYLILRKVGSTVIGAEGYSAQASERLSEYHPCFRGFVDENQIIHLTRIYPPYSPDARWEHQRNVAVDLDQYQRLEQEMSEGDRAALQTCLQVFAER